jgi:hypothetical protein
MTFQQALEYLRQRKLPDTYAGWKVMMPHAVGSLFAFYFHEDWPEDYGSWEGTVSAWMEEGDGDDPSHRNQAVQELTRLIALEIPHEVLQAVGYRLLNCNYHADEDFNVWLGKVRQYVIDAPPFPDPDLLTIEELDDSAGS